MTVEIEFNQSRPTLPAIIVFSADRIEFDQIDYSLLQELSGAPQPSGFVFRQNKFTASPALPFAALAMPAFDRLDADGLDHVEIELNHFLCDCDKIAWFVGAVVHGYDADAAALARGGTMAFLRRLYAGAGSCLRCDDDGGGIGLLRGCEADEARPFAGYAETALSNGGSSLRCAQSGRPVRPGSSFNYEEDRTTTTTRPPRLIPNRDREVKKHGDFGGGSATVTASFMLTATCLLLLSSRIAENF